MKRLNCDVTRHCPGIVLVFVCNSKHTDFPANVWVFSQILKLLDKQSIHMLSKLSILFCTWHKRSEKYLVHHKILKHDCNPLPAKMCPIVPNPQCIQLNTFLFNEPGSGLINATIGWNFKYIYRYTIGTMYTNTTITGHNKTVEHRETLLNYLVSLWRLKNCFPLK